MIYIILLLTERVDTKYAIQQYNFYIKLDLRFGEHNCIYQSKKYYFWITLNTDIKYLFFRFNGEK